MFISFYIEELFFDWTKNLSTGWLLTTINDDAESENEYSNHSVSCPRGGEYCIEKERKTDRNENASDCYTKQTNETIAKMADPCMNMLSKVTPDVV